MGRANSSELLRTWVGGLGVLVVFGGIAWKQCGGTTSQDECQATARLLAARRADYRVAIGRAKSWIDALPIDPVQLRLRGQKGKKHFVEALSAYWRLYRIAGEAERTELMGRVRRLTDVTSAAAYHDMAINSDDAFKQDATSYLRAALLMERMGLDTTRYREEIVAIHPRLNAHMKKRGVHQRMVFAWYYRHFGLSEPFPLATAFADGIISRRVAPAALQKRDIYELTHEVFGPYEYGDRLDADPFTVEEKRYLLETIPTLIDMRIANGDPDLVAELVACLRELRFTGVPEYRRGLEYLLSTQRGDGAWGHYEQYRQNLKDLVEPTYVLHTTMVAIDALTLAFHEPWNSGAENWCSHANPLMTAGRAQTTAASSASAGAVPLGTRRVPPHRLLRISGLRAPSPGSN